MAVRGVHQMTAQVVEILQGDETLGDVDEIDLIREESPDQGGLEDVLHGGGQVSLLHLQGLESAKGIGDVSQGGFLPFQRVDQKAQLVPVDPALDRGEDLLFGEVLLSDAKDQVGGEDPIPGALEREGPILVGGGDAFSGETVEAGDRLQSPSPLPPEVVQHPAADPLQQLGVRPLEKVDDDLPLLPSPDLEQVQRRLPGLPGTGHFLVGELEPHLTGQGLEELSFFCQERALVGSRAVLRVGDLQRPHLLAPDLDELLHHPGGFLEAFGLEYPASEGDPSLAHLRILPPRGDGLDDPLQPNVPGDLLGPKDLPHLIEAEELLGPLLQPPENVVKRLILCGHGPPSSTPSWRGGTIPLGHSTIPLPVRPSKRTLNESESRTWRTNSVSSTAGLPSRYAQRMNPLPDPGPTVKYPTWKLVRLWKKWDPWLGSTFISGIEASTMALAPLTWLHVTGIPSHGSELPHRPNPMRR